MSVLVDLRGTEDTLLVDPAQDDELVEAVAARVRVVEERYHRTVAVEQVERTGRAEGAWADAARTAWMATLLGFFTVMVVSFVRGPVARTRTRGVVRVALLAGVALAGGALLAVPWSETGAVEVGATAMLPRPSALVHALAPTGASVQGVGSALFDAGFALQPVLVLLGWCLLGLGALLLARRLGSFVPGSSGLRPEAGRWRLAVLAVAVPCGLLWAAAPVVLPASPAAPEILPSLASTSSCSSTGELESVADLNRLTSTLRASAIQGADVGANVRLQDGRTPWLFGDTLRDAGFDGPRFVRNSMLVVGDGCLRAVLPEDRGAVIPGRDDGTGYWPMSVGRVGRPGYDLVAVTAQRVRTTGEGPFDFETLGPAVAVYVVPRGGTPQLVRLVDVGADDPDRSSPAWGAAAAVHDGWVYLYGTANPDQPLVFGYSLQVGRVRPTELLRTERWRYWNGSGWSEREQDAAELVPAQDGVSQTLSVFEREGRWYAVSKRNDFLGSELVVWSAPSPTGPFAAGPPVARLESEGSAGVLRYMPLAHPDLLPRRGSVVVSYSRNEGRTERILDDPRRYRPRFLRVPLP